jgi:hypothetical protein
MKNMVEMKFLILISVLIGLSTIIFFILFRKKIANPWLRYLWIFVGVIFAAILTVEFQSNFVGDPYKKSIEDISYDFIIKLGIFSYIVFKFLDFKKKRENLQEKVGCFPYIIATLSFTPLFGVLLGFISAIFGFFTKKKGGGVLAVIGVSGIVFSYILIDIGVISALNTNEATAIFDAMEKSDSSVIELNYTVEYLESFKEQTGNYPTVIANNNKESTYYELVDPEHYYLLNPGKDKIPFTVDDIIPSIKLIKKKKTGLLIKPIKKKL